MDGQVKLSTLFRAISDAEFDAFLFDQLDDLRQALAGAFHSFLARTITPESSYQFECRIEVIVRQAARSFLQHEGKILATHCRRLVVVDVPGADHVPKHAGNKFGLGRVVDRGRVRDVRAFDLDGHAHAGADVGANFSDLCVDQGRDTVIEGSNGAGNLRRGVRVVEVSADWSRSTQRTVTFGALSAIEPRASPDYIALAALLALMVGVFRVVLGLLRLGKVANLLSEPVLLGFTTGAAILIVTSQLPKTVVVTPCQPVGSRCGSQVACAS